MDASKAACGGDESCDQRSSDRRASQKQTTLKLDEDYHQASSSILKLSHHNPSASNGKQQEKQQSSKPLQAEHKEAPMDMFRLKTGKTVQQRDHDKGHPARKSKLISLMNNPGRLSFNSLRPTRTTTREPGNKLQNSNTTNLPLEQHFSIDANSSTSGGMSLSDESLSLLNEMPSVFAAPFLANGLPSDQMMPYPPGPLTTQHHALMLTNPMLLPQHHRPTHSPSALLGYHSFPTQQQQQQQHLHRHPSFEHLYGISPHVLGTHNLLGPRAQPAGQQEMFVADQSSEHYQKIRLNKLDPHQGPFQGGGDTLPLFLASSIVANNNQNQVHKNNTNSILQAAAQISAAVAAQQKQSQQQQQQLLQATVHQTPSPVNSATSVAASALSSAAVAAILTERAKNLISQLSQQTQSSNKSSIANVRNNREASLRDTSAPSDMQHKLLLANTHGGSSMSNANSNQNNNLANMLKSAAEAWATNNVATPLTTSQTVVGPGNAAATDANPTIIFEHDGPTITTLDFNGNPLGPARPAPNDDDDDDEDEVSSFYTEEAEQGGSQNSQRLVRPHKFVGAPQREQSTELGGHEFNSHQAYHSGKRHSHNHHFPLHGHSDVRSPSSNFEHQSHNQMRASSVPTPSEFFDEKNGSNNAGELIGGEHAAKSPSGAGSGEYERPHQQRGNPDERLPRDHYPDSINAIKEQGGDTFSSGAQTSAPGNQGDKSATDPIESLIKELHELHRTRKAQRANSVAKEETERGKGIMKSSSDDYEDIMSGQRDERPVDTFDQEHEQTRLLRKKLLARLRAKHDRKKPSGSSSSFHEDSIRIPLHALLLAALDRRMSSSESKIQSVSQDNLLLDERNKDILLQGRRDFSESTADLGSLLDDNSHLFERLANSAVGAASSKVEESLKPFNLPNTSHESLTPTGMLLLENLSSFDALNQQKITSSGPQAASGNNPHDQTVSETTRTPSSSSTTSSPSPAEAPTTTTTTSTSTTIAPTPLLDDPRNRPSYRNHREQSRFLAGPDSRSSKGRRAIQDESDFDVDRQVDSYANDQYDRSLEPSWMKSSGRGGKGIEPVDFDDEFNEIDRQTRRKMARPRRRKKHQPHSETDYAASENRFLNKMRKETADDINDVDQTIANIESSIPDEEQQARLRLERQQREQQDEDGDDRPLGHNNGHRRDQSDESDGDEAPPLSRDDPDEEASEGPAPSRRYPAREASESQRRNSATWKANMVDDEVSRLEQEAKRQRRQRRLQEEGGQPQGVDDEQLDSVPAPSVQQQQQPINHEAEHESQLQLKTTPQPSQIASLTQFNGLLPVSAK